MMTDNAGSSGFGFAECLNPDCRFRFPVELAAASRLLCPRCCAAIELTVPAPGLAATAPDRQPDGPPIIGLLDNIRSIHNVGSMFRTADGAGLEQLILCGITATPDHPKLAKAALGAERSIPWHYYANGVVAAAELRARGCFLCAIERLATDEPSLFDAALPRQPLALVVGNEKAGIDPAILEQCDGVYHLPMVGGKTSLNAAVAFGIAAYYLAHVARLPVSRRED